MFKSFSFSLPVFYLQRAGTPAGRPVAGIFRLILPVFLLFLCRTSALPQTFHVSPGGNDSNPGSSSQPWRTIQKAFNSAVPGSTVEIHAGVYNEKTTLNVSGSAAGGYITFRSAPGDTAILDGTGITGDQLILILNKAYVRITDLELRNNLNQTFGTGIWVQGYGNHIELRRNRVHDMRAAAGGGDAMGISVYGSDAVTPISDIIVDSNQIYNCQPGHSESLVFNGNVDSFQVTSNIVHDNNNIGIVMIGGEKTSATPALDHARHGICRGNIVYRCRSGYGGGYAGGIYVDGGKSILVERNSVSQCDIGIEIGCENKGNVADSMIVRDNCIFQNDKRGLSIGGYDYPVTGMVRDCLLLNNTVYRNDTLGTGDGELTVEYALNCVFRNNIFSATSQNRLMTTAVGASAGNQYDYNCWFAPGGNAAATVDFGGAVYASFAEYQAGTGQDSHSIFGWPVFVNPLLPAPDLRLQPASPAINSGDPLFLPGIGERDAAGNIRLSGGRVDDGAYEFGGVDSLAAPILLSPAGGAAAVPLSCTLVWSAVPNALSYHLQVSGDSLFHSIAFEQTGNPDTTAAVLLPAYHSRYYWRVRAQNGTIIGSWSELRFLVTILAAPSFTGVHGTSGDPVITWAPVSGASTYRLQASLEPLFQSRVADTLLADTLFHFAGLPRDTLLRFRVQAVDGGGVSAWSGVVQLTSSPGDTILSVTVGKHWNLVSIPVNVTDSRVVTLFPSAVSHAFRYAAGYQRVDSLFHGIGYWLKFIDDEIIVISGKPRMADTAGVVPGWNLVGGISFPVPAASLTSEPPGMLFSRFFGWEGNYRIEDTLRPGRGYWVKSADAGKLIISAAGGTANPQSLTHIRFIEDAGMPPEPPGYSTDNSTSRPTAYALRNPYPNPFNPSVTLGYDLPEEGFVTARIYDALGREIALIENAYHRPGTYMLKWDGMSGGTASPAGCYFCRWSVVSPDGQVTMMVRKLLLLR
jgi:hypothetical protein